MARWQGQVVFVRHSLPGERALVRITSGGSRSKFLKADAIEIRRPAQGRRPAPCPASGPGGCGGCDFQHVEPAMQRELKARVLQEQLRRLAGIEIQPQVHALPGEPEGREGFGWRTRVEFALDDRGRPGLHRHQSREVVALEDCLIASPGVLDTGILQGAGPRGPQVSAVDVVAPAQGEPVMVQVDHRGVALGPEPMVVEQAYGPTGPLPVQLGARGFWQAHPGAVVTFTDHVMRKLAPQAGERVWDLYCGSGAFTLPLAIAVGATGSVVGIEGVEAAVDSCAAALEAHAPQTPADLVVSDVEQGLAALTGPSPDVIVLDPPRVGAGRAVMEHIADSGARRVAYVACDPAALGRDLGYLLARGWELESVIGFDAYGTTHHVEAIAILHPKASST